MTAHLNPPSERMKKKTSLNEAASSPQIPVSVAPWGAAGAGWQGGGREKRVEWWVAVPYSLRQI